MDRDEAIRALKGGKDGVAEWNSRRGTWQQIPSLARARLSGADLRDADLTGADLAGADLQGANLTEARLRDADLRGANLGGACLYCSDLRSADLRDAILTDVNLTAAIASALSDFEEGLDPPTQFPIGFRVPDTVRCIHGPEDIWNRVFYTHSGLPYVEHQIVIVRPVAELVGWLREDPKRLIQIGPEGLEELVLERLASQGIPATRVGRLNAPDGGVDIIARFCEPLDFLVAIQIESHEAWEKKTGLPKVRGFGGVVTGLPYVTMGLVVTNTAFTRPALDYMESAIVAKHLRGAAYAELCQWLVGNLVMQPTLDSVLPKEIRIPGGPVVNIPESSILDLTGRPFRRTTSD